MENCAYLWLNHGYAPEQEIPEHSKPIKVGQTIVQKKNSGIKI